VGVITIFIRMVEGMRIRLGAPPSRLLLPVAFGASLGGLLTLLGTSGNILADQFLRRAGLPGLSLFALTPLGIIMVATGILYTVLIGRRLLPLRPEDEEQRRLYGLRQYRGELEVLDTFPECGQTLRELALPAKLGVQVLRILRRNGMCVDHPGPQTTIEAGDRLWVQGAVLDLLQSHRSFDYPGLRLMEEKDNFDDEPESYAEALVTPESPLRGHTLVELKFRQRYGVSVIAVSRLGEKTVGKAAPLKTWFAVASEGILNRVFGMRGDGSVGELSTRTGTSITSLSSKKKAVEQRITAKDTAATDKAPGREGILSRLGVWKGRPDWEKTGRQNGLSPQLTAIRFQVGDTLLLRGPEESLASLAESGIVLLQQEVDYRPPRSKRAGLALAITGMVLLTGATGILPIVVAAVLGAGLMIVTGCLNPEEAQESLELRLLVLIAGMLALGVALERSGVVSVLAQTVLKGMGRGSPLILLGSIYLLAALLTQVLSNAVTVVLICPLAIQAAAAAHLNPASLVVSVIVAVSASPATPFGNQVNLLVMGPGRYRMGDYLRVGLPLSLINMAVSMALIPVFWPFKS